MRDRVLRRWILLQQWLYGCLPVVFGAGKRGRLYQLREWNRPGNRVWRDGRFDLRAGWTVRWKWRVPQVGRDDRVRGGLVRRIDSDTVA